MGNFTNPVSPTWVTNVPKIESTDTATAGGEDTNANKTGKALVERTAYLKAQVEAINLAVLGGTGSFGATINADGSRSLTITHNLGSTGYTVDLVPTAHPGGGWGEWWLHSRATNSAELRTTGSYTGSVRWTVRRTTSEA